MVTLKIKYNLYDNNDTSLIYKYIRQYNNAYNVVYNMFSQVKDLSVTAIKKKDSPVQDKLSTINNVDLLDSWFKLSVIDDVSGSYKEGKKVIFGSRKLFNNRMKGLISKEEYKTKKLRPLCSIGEASQYGNRKFRLTEDSNLIFQPDRYTKIRLRLEPYKRKSVLDRIFLLQEECTVPITYKIDFTHIYISIDEKAIEYHNTKKIKNRVMSIDINPNYIGWSICDWKSSSSYNVIKTGIISIKGLNDRQNLSKMNSSYQVRYSNKRKTVIDLISKNLINTGVYYKCDMFSIEDLDFKDKDREHGRRYNKLVNNQWCRNRLVSNIQKRCGINGIRLVQVKPEYSSFIGNILYGELNLPDMVLASLEIGRRAYEFVGQYIDKIKQIRKNIVFPEIEDFLPVWDKSLEEFDLTGKSTTWKQLYSEIKKSKQMYRLSLEKFNLKFSIFLTSKLYCNRYIFD